MGAIITSIVQYLGEACLGCMKKQLEEDNNNQPNTIPESQNNKSNNIKVTINMDGKKLKKPPSNGSNLTTYFIPKSTHNSPVKKPHINHMAHEMIEENELECHDFEEYANLHDKYTQNSVKSISPIRNNHKHALTNTPQCNNSCDNYLYGYDDEDTFVNLSPKNHKHDLSNTFKLKHEHYDTHPYDENDTYIDSKVNQLSPIHRKRNMNIVNTHTYNYPHHDLAHNNDHDIKKSYHYGKSPHKHRGKNNILPHVTSPNKYNTKIDDSLYVSYYNDNPTSSSGDKIQ